MSLLDINTTGRNRNVLSPVVEPTATASSNPLAGFVLTTIDVCIDGVPSQLVVLALPPAPPPPA